MFEIWEWLEMLKAWRCCFCEFSWKSRNVQQFMILVLVDAVNGKKFWSPNNFICFGCRERQVFLINQRYCFLLIAVNWQKFCKTNDYVFHYCLEWLDLLVNDFDSIYCCDRLNNLKWYKFASFWVAVNTWKMLGSHHLAIFQGRERPDDLKS